MPGATLTTLGNILKETYLPPVVEQLNNEVLLLQRLESRPALDLQGKRANVALHSGRSGGIGARAESAALAEAGNQAYAVATFDLKYLYGRVRVTGPSMAKTASDAGAFLKSLSSELDGIRADLKKDTARQVYGLGTGVIVTCGTTTAAVVVVLATREPIDKGQLYVGMVVDIGTLADPVVIASARTITAVNPATPSVTISGAAVTTSSSHFVFRSGNALASSVSNEITGIQEVISATAVHGGINPTTAGNEYWQAQVDATGGSLALDNMVKMFGRTRIQGASPSLLIGSFGLQRRFHNLLQPQVVFNEPMALKGGFKSLDFMGMPLVADIEAPWGKLYFADEKFLKIFENQGWHFLDEDGNVLKWRSGFDEWEAVLARYMQIGATKRNVQGVMTGLTDDPLGF